MIDESEFLALVDSAIAEGKSLRSTLASDNEKALDYYNCELFGDEEEGMSQVVSSDVHDTIEDDLPALLRIFAAGDQIAKFQPNTSADAQEAEEKDAIVNYVINDMNNGFQLKYDWIKSALLQKPAMIKWFVEDLETTDEKEFTGLDVQELTRLMDDLQSDGDEVEVLEHSEEDGLYSVKFKITHKEKRYTIQGVAPEDGIIAGSPRNLQAASLVGELTKKTRSELMREGIKREVIDTMPAYQAKNSTNRFDNQGGSLAADKLQWAQEEVEIFEGYVSIDFDDDGIVELRHVVKSGKVIIENEIAERVQYALLTPTPMPYTVVGKTRAEQTFQSQRTKSVILRQTLDNLYAVNAPGHAIGKNVDIDDMLVIRANRVVRVENGAIPSNEIMELTTPYVGDKSLQIIQYLDQQRAAATGQFMTGQGLSADKFAQETATRFNGIEEKSDDRIELIARIFAETGFRDLYEGIAALVMHHQDTEMSVRVLGKDMTIDPTRWRRKQSCVAQVGMGVGANSRTAEDMSMIFAVQKELIELGSRIPDEQKMYNVLAKATQAMGYKQTDEFFNNPEEMGPPPEQEEPPNPLAEVETIKGQFAQMREELKAQQAQTKMMLEHMAKMTKLEVENNQNIPGSAV